MDNDKSENVLSATKEKKDRTFWPLSLERTSVHVQILSDHAIPGKIA